ncbi:Uncharacterised protein [Burkholderia pseudomallei]|nr:Uncharacterised protein [Burkholderia pseudomallei]CAJ4670365.1 Uncharacterised protein [Burkholderia pseudomallei]VBM94958.1 Uncharacterised protein [Burkholderia pseudomallei]VBX79451.1 Uncharacterised protein [Burkholderia pseudomallei]VBX79481.1 Uncharacterised protein [Burkholderia pseudomallei]
MPNGEKRLIGFRRRKPSIEIALERIALGICRSPSTVDVAYGEGNRGDVAHPFMEYGLFDGALVVHADSNISGQTVLRATWPYLL